jgi:hypothetical protein
MICSNRRSLLQASLAVAAVQALPHAAYELSSNKVGA